MSTKCKKGFKKVGNKCVKTKNSQKSKKRKGSVNKLIFTIASFLLAIFFLFNIFHNWANSFIPLLHFCDHTVCMLFSLIWFGFGIVGLYFLIKKKEMKKIWYLPFIIILIIGIVLMNLTYCEGGKMQFGLGSLFLSSSLTDSHTECTPGVDCAGDVVDVPIPPCVETDAGRDYITFGTILSGANLEDLCMGDILRERYCNSELTYTSEDIDCTTFGAGWTCEEGECREGTPAIGDDPECTIDADCPEGYECLGEECSIIEVIIGNETDCGDSEDNDGDLLIDCADPDCQIPLEEGGCGDFDYSCEHTSIYPTCGGTCPSGYECGIYNSGDGTLDGGWCECMPEEVTSCYESEDCTGWCDDNSEYLCIGDSFGCYCEWAYNVQCIDTDGGWEIEEGGIVYYLGMQMIDYCIFKTDMLGEHACVDYEGVLIGSEAIYDCEEYGLVCIPGLYGEGAYCGEGEL